MIIVQRKLSIEEISPFNVTTYPLLTCNVIFKYLLTLEEAAVLVSQIVTYVVIIILMYV